MKHLPPTLRENQRYMKVQISANQKKDFNEVVDLVNSALKEFAGEKGLAEISPWLIKRKFNYEEQKAVVRVNRQFEQLFRASIIFSEYKIVTLKVSGTLKGLDN